MCCDLAPPLPHTFSAPFWILTAYLSALLANLGVAQLKGGLEEKSSLFLPTLAFFKIRTLLRVPSVYLITHQNTVKHKKRTVLLHHPLAKGNIFSTAVQSVFHDETITLLLGFLVLSPPKPCWLNKQIAKHSIY